MKTNFKTVTAVWVLLTWTGIMMAFPVLAAPTVAVSIAPVHSLVAAVMDGVGEPVLLIPPGQSPHAHSLAPSSARHIFESELIIWIGPEYETALKNAIDQAAEIAEVKSIRDIPGLISYPVRDGGLWEHQDSHVHQHSSDEGAGMRTDPHFWLSTSNAIKMVESIRAWLISIDPDNTRTYRDNSERTILRIRNLYTELQQLLKPVDDIAYILLHDAYQYFEKDFDLQAAGSITLSPDKPPGAKRIRAIRHVMKGNEIKCIFSEPQFSPRLISTLTEDTDVKIAQLDPLGAEINPGPELWYEVMTGLGDSLSGCLK